MKIYVFGSNGMLGNYVCKYLKSNNLNVIGIKRDDYDLSTIDIHSFTQFIDNLKLNQNDIVINCAGIIPQSKNYDGSSIKEYINVNSVFPILLSNIINKYNAKMIHITTDCVFSGKNGNYIETDNHDETNLYGTTKSLGENCDCTIIRTSIIGEELNKKVSLLEWVKSNKNKEINGYTNHYWNGVSCLELSKIIYKIITDNLYWNGVRHIYSPYSVSKYELTKIINDVYDLNIKINTYECHNKIDKTMSTIYNTNNLFNIKTIYDQIVDLKNYKFN